MTAHSNTAYLRLEGPLQAWGTTSHFSVRATENVPSKSGVIGLICCARGWRRSEASANLARFSRLAMGVRIDRPGQVMMDYHTTGARIGVMSAQGKIKITQTTGEIETQVSRCYYLADASFLVALMGDAETIREVKEALINPVWPIYLGRKSCPPSWPAFESPELLDNPKSFATLEEALAAARWHPRTADEETHGFSAVLETEPTTAGATPVQDVPLTLTPPTYGYRYTRHTVIGAEAGPERQPVVGRLQPSKKAGRWQEVREQRLKLDLFLCVFCKSPADHVHHLTYENAPHEKMEDLRSVCALCHNALTMIEYSEGRTDERVDPCDPALRRQILEVRDRILQDSIPLRIRRRGD